MKKKIQITQNLKSLFAKQIWARKHFHSLVLLYETVYLNLFLKIDSLNTLDLLLKKCCLNSINNELIKWVSYCHYFKDLTILTYIYFLFFLFFKLSLTFSVLSRGTKMKIRRFCPFCAIQAISTTVLIYAKTCKF